MIGIFHLKIFGDNLRTGHRVFIESESFFLHVRTKRPHTSLADGNR